MKCHRVNEVIELLHPGYKGKLEELTDDVLIYHLKMRNSQKDEMIPGLAKDQEDDFKTAILKARGIIK